MRWLEYIVFLAIVLGLAQPTGLYLARVCQGQRTPLDPLLRPIESALYRLLGVRPEQEMAAGVYIFCFLLFGLGSAVVLFLVLIFQRLLPGGPADAYLTTPMTTDLAVNTAVSFTTTTTWQAYAGENTLRYLAQVVGLVAQNFLAGVPGWQWVSPSSEASPGNAPLLSAISGWT
jgi:K+-transporting ATPase ATPase A chain